MRNLVYARAIAAVIGVGVLTACGADGEPVRPTVSGQSTVGVNSNTGVFNNNSVTIGLEL
jgi:hypothetical protein